MADDTPFITADEVKGRWLKSQGEFPATDDQLQNLIADAQDAILREFPDILERIADPDDGLKMSTLKRVTARMVLRVLRNPDGARTVQESAGEFSQTRTVAGDYLGEIELTDQDRADLAARPATRATPKAFTLMPRGV